MSDISDGRPKMVRFRGELFTPRGSIIEMGALIARVKSEAQEVLESFPEDVYGSGKLEQAVGLLGEVETEFDRVADEMRS